MIMSPFDGEMAGLGADDAVAVVREYGDLSTISVSASRVP